MKQTGLFDKLYNILQPIYEHRHFDKITGVIAMCNPIAMAPQLYNCIVMENVEGVSVAMYVIFILLQAVFALVAIKAKNKGMFLAMVISILISVAIVMFTLLKS